MHSSSIQKIKDFGSFHISSFDYIIDHGIQELCQDIEPVYLDENVKISVFSISIKSLSIPMTTRHRRTPRKYPSEARMGALTYYAELPVVLHLEKYNGTRLEDEAYCERVFFIPAMVQSKMCYLNGLNEQELIGVKEDVNDPGGYFIVNGKERLIRQFVVPRRNYPLALAKSVWKLYKGNYSEFGILVRSIKNEHLISSVVLHYLTDGSYKVRFYYDSKPYHIGVIVLMKALVDRRDDALCYEISKYSQEFPTDQLKRMIRDLQDQGICTQKDALEYLGKLFCEKVHLPPNSPFHEVADYLLRKSFLVHLDDLEDKFQFLCYSMCKLHCAVQNKCRLDDLDNPVFQEVLASGQTYMIALKLGIVSYLKSVKNTIGRSLHKRENIFHKKIYEKCCNRAVSFSEKMASFISTGNLPSRRQHGLPSETGYTIALKRTNIFELAAQFSAVCQFSANHYSKNQRKYYPEAWGFFCPAQTPEGENCGLYNHLASQCELVKLNEKKIELQNLKKLKIHPCDEEVSPGIERMFVLVDGHICGWIKKSRLGKLYFRFKKLKAKELVPYHSEIVYLPKSEWFFEGIFLFSTPCRWVRKVLRNSKLDFVGCFEQTLLSFLPDLPEEELTETRETNILSLSAAMIPYTENNPAIRNIFSSTKCKQALGVPHFNINYRAETKSSLLVYSQSPTVSTEMYSERGFDMYPHGTNCVVAVLSYSGFDMEDAIVLNKNSVERGLMMNVVYKTTFYTFKDLAKECGCGLSEMKLERDESDWEISHFLDRDGLPHVGCRIKYNNPILSIYNTITKGWHIKTYLERNTAQVHSVKIMSDPALGSNTPTTGKKISITFSIMKCPEAGDKFSNRHGGKGICSYLMPSEDMPFTGDGLVPDILFNPHGLPSRMSIGMLYEMIAAKADVCKGSMCVLKSFTMDNSLKTYETIGEALQEAELLAVELEKAGFNSYGTEKFHSGTSGLELEAEVFCGLLYYLRLHHLVEDKYQVLSVGPVDERTYQPINPDKSGAVRFGEMERDAILAHGALEVTLDRLNCDRCTAFICSKCHTLLYPSLQHPIPEERFSDVPEFKHCDICNKESGIKVQIPYVLVYLISELSVIKIKVKLFTS